MITLFTVYFFDAKVKDILSKVKAISELRKIVNDQKINLQTNEHKLIELKKNSAF